MNDCKAAWEPDMHVDLQFWCGRDAGHEGSHRCDYYGDGRIRILWDDER